MDKEELLSQEIGNRRTSYSKDIVELLRAEADHVVTIMSPSTSTFGSVGRDHQDFTQVTDQQVLDILRNRA